MKPEYVYRVAIILFALGALSVAGSIMGQSDPPEKARGISRKLVASFDLGPEVDGMSGRFLRQYRTTIEPGGATVLHDHIGLPEIIFVLGGRLTEHQGGESREYGPGESFASGKGVRHWLENRGTEPVMLIATFISRPR